MTSVEPIAFVLSTPSVSSFPFFFAFLYFFHSTTNFFILSFSYFLSSSTEFHQLPCIFFFSFFIPTLPSTTFFFLLQTCSPCSSTHNYIPKNRNPLLIFMILVFDLRIPRFGFGFSVWVWVCSFGSLIWRFCVGVFGFSVFVVVVWSLGCDGGGFVWLVVVLMIENFFFLWL